MTESTWKPKLAIIGCGAVTDHVHLPVTKRSDRFRITALVDKSLRRASRLATEHGVPIAAEDYREVADQVDAALLALPHHLHAPVATGLLEQGVHVLVEKPMALTVQECDAMIETADRSDAVLAVGLVRRFYRPSLFVKQALEDGLIGDPVSFDVREGMVYRWKVASDFMFRKEAGGGVLADTGAHTLDLILWWMGDYETIDYRDDAMGGVEADCELRLQMKNGAMGFVELSRTRALRNSFIIHGERASLEVGTGFKAPVTLRVGDSDVRLTGHPGTDDDEDHSIEDVFVRQLEDFAAAITGDRDPFVSGREGRRAVRLIEACHASRRSLDLPWLDPRPTTTAGAEEGVPA